MFILFITLDTCSGEVGCRFKGKGLDQAYNVSKIMVDGVSEFCSRLLSTEQKWSSKSSIILSLFVTYLWLKLLDNGWWYHFLAKFIISQVFFLSISFVFIYFCFTEILPCSSDQRCSNISENFSI